MEKINDQADLIKKQADEVRYLWVTANLDTQMHIGRNERGTSATLSGQQTTCIVDNRIIKSVLMRAISLDPSHLESSNYSTLRPMSDQLQGVMPIICIVSLGTGE